MINDKDDEILDIVNDSDQVIGQQLRSSVYKNKISHVRVVNLFLINSKGELWIPRRIRTKITYPLSLDMSMGGHVKSGETYEQALARELQEELGLDLCNYKYTLLGYLTPVKDDVPAFMKVYEIFTNETPQLNKEEFIEASWISPKELLKRIKEGEKAKKDLARLIELFYDN